MQQQQPVNRAYMPPPDDGEGNNISPEVLKILLQQLGLDGQQQVLAEIEIVIDWDKLEDLLVAEHGVNPDSLGYELTSREKERLSDLADKHHVSPVQYMRLRRKPGSKHQ